VESRKERKKSNVRGLPIVLQNYRLDIGFMISFWDCEYGLGSARSDTFLLSGWTHTVKVVVVKFKHVLLRYYLMPSSTIFVFVIQQYNLIVCVDFSLICYEPKVNHLLTGIAMSLADNGKSFWHCGDDLKNCFVDYSVRKIILLGTIIYDIYDSARQK